MSDSIAIRKLHRACREGDPQRVRDLIQDGVDPNVCAGKKSRYPLSLAIEERSFDIADTLLEAGAKPRQAADQLEWLVQRAKDRFESERRVWVQRILEDPCEETGVIAQPLVARCVESDEPDVDLIKRMLDVCGDPADWSARWSPLCSAIREKKSEIAMLLIDSGFNHQSHKEHELPPACVALLRRMDDVLQKLIDIGEDPNRIVSAHALKFKGAEHACDRYPQNDRCEIFSRGTLLHYAAIVGGGPCVQVLLDAGADVDAIDSEGRTAADLAAIGGKFTKEAADLLPSSDRSSGVALHDRFIAAIKAGTVDELRACVDAGSDPNQIVPSRASSGARPITTAAHSGNLAMLQFLCEIGVDIDSRDLEAGATEVEELENLADDWTVEECEDFAFPKGRTPLGWAALRGHVEIIRWLLQKGADADTRDCLGLSFLHLSAMGNCVEGIKMALDAGCDRNATAVVQITPLHLAASVGATQAVEALLEAGADIALKTKRGETALKLAKEDEHTETAKVIQSHKERT